MKKKKLKKKIKHLELVLKQLTTANTWRFGNVTFPEYAKKMEDYLRRDSRHRNSG